MKDKNKCLEDLKVYYGIWPYDKHVNRGSGYYYNWLRIKYGRKLIRECEEKLECQK